MEDNADKATTAAKATVTVEAAGKEPAGREASVRRGAAEQAAADQAVEQREAKEPAVLAWIVAALWAALIFWMSSNDAAQMGTGLFSAITHAINGFLGGLGIQGDPASVLGHFAEYMIFGALLANALRRHAGGWTVVVMAVLLASLYGITDEFHQMFVPGRMCDPFDWMVDTIAATVGATCLCAVVRLRRKKGASVKQRM